MITVQKSLSFLWLHISLVVAPIVCVCLSSIGTNGRLHKPLFCNHCFRPRINASHADLEEYSVFPAKYKPQLFCGASLLQQLFVDRLKCLRGILWHLCRDFWNVKDSYKHSLWPSYFFPWAAHFHCAAVGISDVHEYKVYLLYASSHCNLLPVCIT